MPGPHTDPNSRAAEGTAGQQGKGGQAGTRNFSTRAKHLPPHEHLPACCAPLSPPAPHRQITSGCGPAPEGCPAPSCSFPVLCHPLPHSCSGPPPGPPPTHTLQTPSAAPATACLHDQGSPALSRAGVQGQLFFPLCPARGRAPWVARLPEGSGLPSASPGPHPRAAARW